MARWIALLSGFAGPAVGAGEWFFPLSFALASPFLLLRRNEMKSRVAAKPSPVTVGFLAVYSSS